MEPLIPGYYYHMYNHANGDDQLYREQKNYDYFLEKLKEHILPVADFYSYCLMPNHFHFLVKIKDETQIQSLESFPSDLTFPKFQTLEKIDSLEKLEHITSNFISNQFQIFLALIHNHITGCTTEDEVYFLKILKEKGFRMKTILYAW